MNKLLALMWVGLTGASASVLLSVATAPLSTATASQVEQGHAQFNYWCAPCHAREPREGGRLLPGTASLKAKYGAEKPAALEDRTDLAPELTKAVIRRGIAGMPSFRKTEISDRDMQDIADYLARNAH